MSEVWLSKKAHKKLSDELFVLKNEKHPEIAKKVELAREEGDLKENAGYHAAREDLSRVIARIKQLETIIKSAKVGISSDSKNQKTICAGMQVKVEIDGKKSDYIIGSREMQDTTAITVISPDSPIGSVLLDKKVGEKIKFNAPNGNTVDIKIISFNAFK